MQLESVWGLSASSEAATGGHVGAAMTEVQPPLPPACLVSPVTHHPKPSCIQPDSLLDSVSAASYYAC